MLVSGSITKCMGRVSLHGLMEGDMKETTMMTKNREEVCLHGPMVVATMANGSMANSMVKVSTILPREKSDVENGKKVKGFSGIQKKPRKVHEQK